MASTNAGYLDHTQSYNARNARDFDVATLKRQNDERIAIMNAAKAQAQHEKEAKRLEKQKMKGYGVSQRRPRKVSLAESLEYGDGKIAFVMRLFLSL